MRCHLFEMFLFILISLEGISFSTFIEFGKSSLCMLGGGLPSEVLCYFKHLFALKHIAG